MRAKNFFLLFPVFTFGCAQAPTIALPADKINAPRIVALDAPAAPWVPAFTQQLRKQGFKVLRWASQKRVTDKSSDRTSEEYSQASTRYVIMVSGQINPMLECLTARAAFLDPIAVEVVDTQENETVISYTSSGYTEPCPLSGRPVVFADFAQSLSSAWKE